jgi:hypothetical protein
MPRCKAMLTACARSLALSLERMFEMWFLTVVSPIESLSAICLLELPVPIKRSTSISRTQLIVGSVVSQLLRDLGWYSLAAGIHGADRLQ